MRGTCSRWIWEGKTGRGHMNSTGKNERRKAPKKTDKERQEER